MARIPLLCLLSLLLLASGCAPKNPLDRKVRAGTPEQFFSWWDRTQKKLPENEREEVHEILLFLKQSTPRLRPMQEKDPNDPLCKRIDGLTLREVLVLGYQDKNHQVRMRLMRETGNLAPLVAMATDATDDLARERIEATIRQTKLAAERSEEKIAHNSRRIAELETPSAP